MATRRGSNKTQYISKGQRPNVSRWTRKACRRAYKADSLAVTLNKVDAWKKGKKVFLTIPNQGADVKKIPYIRVPAKVIWGNPNTRYMMKAE